MRYPEKMCSTTAIAWEALHQLLEGHIVHLPVPKNHRGRDIESLRDIPIFATADMPIIYSRHGVIDQVNTQMMNVRWRYFELWDVLPESRRKEIRPCAHCFAELILGQCPIPEV